MKILSLCLVLLSTIIFTSDLRAAGVQVNWNNPNSYKDINQGNRNRVRFEKSLFDELGSKFAKLAKSLPEDQFLMVQVYDLDLAGEVTYGQSRTIRIIRDVETPKIKFAYQLMNKDNKVLKEGIADIVSSHYMRRAKRITTRLQFGYEKEMIENWFNDNLLATKS